MKLCGELIYLVEEELAQIHGGMFAAHMNSKGSPVMRMPSAQPQPFSGKAMVGAMVNGAIVGGGNGARTGAAAPMAVGGALLGGMGHCGKHVVTNIQGPIPPTNANAYTVRRNPFTPSTSPWKG